MADETTTTQFIGNEPPFPNLVQWMEIWDIVAQNSESLSNEDVELNMIVEPPLGTFVYSRCFFFFVNQLRSAGGRNRFCVFLPI